MQIRNIKIKKYLSIVALAAALLGGSVITQSQTTDASSDYYVVFKHNSYVYNSRGRRTHHRMLKAIDVWDSYGKHYIHGRAYYRIGRNEYVRARDVIAGKDREITLRHNAYTYNVYGRRNGRTVYHKGDSYDICGAWLINGQKYYLLYGNHFIKASNVDAPAQSSKSNVNTNGNNKQNKPTNSGKNSISVTMSNGTSDGIAPLPSKKTSIQNNNNTTKSVKHYTLNHIILPDGFASELRKVGTGSDSRIINMRLQAEQYDTFHSESAADDNMKINYKNLTPSQQREISLFALRLINEMRAKLGSRQLNYSYKAQQTANTVARIYNEDHKGLGDGEHDLNALDQASLENNTHSLSECMGGGVIDNPWDRINTMTDLKKKVYMDIFDMVLSTSEEHHAQILINWDNRQSGNDGNTQFALSVSYRNRDPHFGKPEYSLHYILY